MDRLRQSVFSSLGHAVENARVLDLFAGTGSYGLDAISRGAASAIFVEANRKACGMIKENAGIVAKSLGQDSIDAEIICHDALKFQYAVDAFDLIFVDPPYELIESVFDRLFSRFEEYLASAGVVVFEMPGHLQLQASGWRLRKRLGKGSRQPTCCLYEKLQGDSTSSAP